MIMTTCTLQDLQEIVQGGDPNEMLEDIYGLHSVQR